MESFLYLSPSQINFIPIKENKNYVPPKNCHICSVELGSLGLIRAARKVCYYCKRILCKKCTLRKVSEDKRRVCSDCYSNALKNYFESEFLRKGKEENEKIDFELREKHRIVKEKNAELERARERTERETKFEGKNEEKSLLLPLLNKVKQQKEKCNRARERIWPLEQELLKAERIFEELSKEIYVKEKEHKEREEELQCIKENLATAQDLNDGLLNRFKDRSARAVKNDSGIQVKSVKDLKRLKSLKDSELDELIKRKQEFVEELERLENEIEVYTKRKSCRHSGMFQ